MNGEKMSHKFTRPDWNAFHQMVKVVAQALGTKVSCEQKYERLQIDFRLHGLNSEQVKALSTLENLVELVSEFPPDFLSRLDPSPSSMTQVENGP